MLYLVATPIGNLSDFSSRAQETLQSVDYILCEDTRTSRVLLEKYHIKKPLKSFHKFNETLNTASILQDLAKGLSIALISDAGTPTVSDPGEKLIASCIQHNLPLTHIPGPSALITALVLSGFPSSPFQFLGFLPKKPHDYKKALSDLLSYPGTTLIYESPHRLTTLLSLLPPERNLSISRELTKKFEQTLRGPAKELRAHFEIHPPRGEFTVAISSGTDTLAPPLTLEETYRQYTEEGLSPQSAIKQLSQKFRRTKREIENQLQNSTQRL